MKLRIATRKSELALTQTRWVASKIWEHAPEVDIEEVHIVTKGDRVTDKPLAAIGGKGLFISEVEAAVSRGEADLAVHSLKDVPGDVELAEGMDIVCTPEREDPRDVLLTRDGSKLDELSAGARVGTTSLRRVAQLHAQRPDLAYVTLRGNVGTRLRRLEEGKYDAIVLAAAGLKRLGLLEGRAHELLPIETCLPAVGQGTLALEARADDSSVRELVAPLEHGPSRLRMEAERALLKKLEGSCRVPMAGHGLLFDDGARLSLHAMVADVDGDKILNAGADCFFQGRSQAEKVTEARALGEELAATLIEQGARELMREAEAAVLRRESQGNGSGPKGGYGWNG